MATRTPVTELDTDYSDADARATSWADAREHLEKAEIFWLSTVRPDGRPHVTPLISVWVDDALHFCTGIEERKFRNLSNNAHCILTTGCNQYGEGLDLVVEGDAMRVSDDARLQRIADAYESKYGSDWHFDVRDGAFYAGDREDWVYEVAPVTAFGFAKGNQFGQTRWRF